MNTTSYYSSISRSNNNNAGPLAGNDANTKAWRRDEKILLASRSDKPSWGARSEPSKHKQPFVNTSISDANLQSKHSAYLNGGTTPIAKSRFSERHYNKEKEAPHINISPFAKDKNWGVPIQRDSSASGWLSQMFPTNAATPHPTRRIATTRGPAPNANNRHNTFKPKKLMLSRPKTRRLIASILDGRTNEAENETSKTQEAKATWRANRVTLTAPEEEKKDHDNGPSPSNNKQQPLKERLNEYYPLTDSSSSPDSAPCVPGLLVKTASKLLSRSSSFSSSLSSGPAKKKKAPLVSTTNTKTQNVATAQQETKQTTTTTKVKPMRPTTNMMPNNNPIDMQVVRRNSSIPLVIVITKQPSFTKSSTATSAATSPTTTMKSSSTTTMSTADLCDNLCLEEDDDGRQKMESFYSSPSRKYFQEDTAASKKMNRGSTTANTVSPSGAAPTCTVANKLNRELLFSHHDVDKDDAKDNENDDDGVPASNNNIVPRSIHGNENENDVDDDDSASALTDADYGVLDEYSFAPSDYTPSTFGSATF